MQRLTASNIAGAIIAASGRPHSIDEAMSVLQDVNWALNPDPNNPKYAPWKALNRTQKVHT
ncbi:MAG: hypothetical protein ACXWVO_02990 [Caulobacteraceae bacterium]